MDSVKGSLCAYTASDIVCLSKQSNIYYLSKINIYLIQNKPPLTKLESILCIYILCNVFLLKIVPTWKARWRWRGKCDQSTAKKKRSTDKISWNNTSGSYCMLWTWRTTGAVNMKVQLNNIHHMTCCLATRFVKLTKWLPNYEAVGHSIVLSRFLPKWIPLRQKTSGDVQVRTVCV